MAGIPLFYDRVEPLNLLTHADVSVAPKTDMRFAAGTNAVFLTLIEFATAALEYPIVFVKDSESNTFSPQCVLGLTADKNMFVGNDGKWNGGYVPAYIRRYPFVLADQQTPEHQFTVCVESTYEGLNKKGEGHRLFEAGKPSPYLESVLDLLRDYQSQCAITTQITAELEEKGLLEPVNASWHNPDQTVQQLSGFYCVSREKLLKLDNDTLAAWARNGVLENLFFHLMSLGNFSKLLVRATPH